MKDNGMALLFMAHIILQVDINYESYKKKKKKKKKKSK